MRPRTLRRPRLTVVAGGVRAFGDGGGAGACGDCVHRMRPRRDGSPTPPKELPVNKFALVLKSLLLSLALSASAFAAGKVNINTADAGTIAASLNGIGQAKAEAI